MLDQGYLYIVCNKEKFYEEAFRSAKSLRKVDGNAHITIICDRKIKNVDRLFDKVIIRAFKPSNFIEAILYRVRYLYELSPYKKTFFVDSDTYFFESAHCLFRLLDYYDVCLAQAPSDVNIPHIKGQIMEGYTPYNMGILLFRKNAANKKLFSSWLKIYDEKKNIYPTHDQPSFVEALLDAKSRVYTLSSLWNARLPAYQSFPASTIKIVHGRHDDYEKLRKIMNSVSVNRAWDPRRQKLIYRKRDVLRQKLSPSQLSIVRKLLLPFSRIGIRIINPSDR